MIWDAVWDVGCNLFGFIAIIGPFLMIGWYYKAAREKFKIIS